MDTHPQHLVAVIGAGPAGLFAARELAQRGMHVCLFNRDIKPGGLAEYGIYPDKYRMKFGLRGQFYQILAMENIEYFGNLLIGEEGDLTLDEVRHMGFEAVLVTAGAQGTKWLGLPGEHLIGVYHAKDLVYHYNRLPPYSQQSFSIGRRAAVIGAGNVMLDISRWLSQQKHVEEIYAIARRGPAEVKFDRKELEFVVANLDMTAFEEELQRVTPLMLSLEQDPDETRKLIELAREKALPTHTQTHLTVHFLAAPVRILGDEKGHVCGIELEENTLVNENGEIKARNLGSRHTLAVDTVIFAIGDRVDERFGLPMREYEFVKNPNPQYPVDGQSYEAYDPNTCTVIEGMFIAGWSRKASTGLVGIARKDGTNGAQVVLQYLQPQAPLPALPLEAIHARLDQLGKPIVNAADVQRLLSVESENARKLGVEDFKFATNEEMLEAMGFA